MYRESLEVNRDLGAKWAIAYLFEDIGVLAAMEGQSEQALQLCGAATRLREEIGSPRSPAEADKLLNNISLAVAQLSPEEVDATEERGHEMSLDAAIAYALEVAHL
ncbi:MAG: hypothetical protein HC802_13355 [Caldilineaceae bacterium]|nr:hypothetical protein [Caldilineaceae bacterium]